MITPLDPVIAEIIPKLPLRDPDDDDAAERARCAAGAGCARAAVPPPPVADVKDITVKGAAGPLAARVYRNGQDKSPTVVFFHGGGWVAGDLETHDRQARLLVIETGAVVVSVDYRRPPETRFPGAFEDAFASVRDIVKRIDQFGGDSQAHRRRRRQRRRQSGGNGRDCLSRRRHHTRRSIAGLSRDRCRRQLCRRKRECALSLAHAKTPKVISCRAR